MSPSFGADLLVVGAHPDDLELHFGGIVAKSVRDGLHVVGLDLTQGERASRGTPEQRQREATAAARELGLPLRINAGLPDAGVNSTEQEQVVRVVEVVRTLRPRWVLAPHPEDPHPDHREGGRLIERALYFAHVGGFPAEGERHRARGLLHDWPEAGGRAAGYAAHGAGIVIDVSDSFAAKAAALACYASQFDSDPAGPATRLNRPTFLASVEARARRLGELIGVTHGEGLVHAGALGWSGPLQGLFGEGGFAQGPSA